MSTRYTGRDVDAAFERMVKCAEAAGLDTHGWVVNHGSKLNGVAYRIFRREEPGGGLSDLGFTSGNGFLGMTAREACDMLRAYASAFYAVAERHGWTS